MNFKRKKTIIILIFLLMILILTNNVHANEIKKGNYSKKYEEWLQLSDEEKNKTIPPLAFNVRNSSKSLVDRFINVLKSSTIPSRYDLREHINNVEVKNQMNTGECWAFSTNTSLETNLALKDQTYNFSERHIDYDTAKNYIDGINENALNRNVGEGGLSSTAFTYYSRGSGPILEEDMPFINNEFTIRKNELPRNIAVKKVDNMIYFPSVFKRKNENGEIICEDGNGKEYSNAEVNDIRNEVKRHIKNYGGITIGVFAPSENNYFDKDNYSAYVNENGNFANHAVTIIGWDDNFSKDNFIKRPSIDGAYIVLNSWGNEWGDNGVYYISYEDFLVESSMIGITNVSDIEYDTLYQHDISEMCNCIEAKYGANVFTAQENGKLTEVMVGSLSDQTCNIYISVEEDKLNMENRIKVANEVSLKPGYNTISLTSDINVTKGKKFAVIVELTNENFEGIGIEDSTAIFSNAVSNKNESFISSNGSKWNDIYDNSNMMNLSIKAYTQDEEKHFRLTDINGRAYENFGGKFSITVDTSYIENGNIIDVNIHDNEKDVTSMFNICNNRVKGKGAFITIECPSDIKKGNYTILINLKGFNTITSEFSVQEIPQDTITMTFVDENLYRNIQAKLSNYINDDKKLQIITNQEEIENIEVLDLEDIIITNLSGIENFSNLKNLNLQNTNIEDLSPLSNLENIEVLNLNNNSSISNLDFIKSYKNISELYLKYDWRVLDNEDINILSNLSSLKKINLGDTGIKDISWICNLNNLTYLDLSNNSSINEFSIIENLTNIEHLNLSCTEIRNLELLESLKNLKELFLNSNNIENINFLKNLNKLTKLSLSSNKIIDISVIRNLDKLEYLDLSNNNISNIDVLENFTYFSHLLLSNNKIKDITPLKKLINYGWLELSNNNIEDISNLHKPRDMAGFIFLKENIINGELTINDKKEISVELPQILKVAINKNDDFDYVYSEYELHNCKLSEDKNSILIDPTVSMTASIAVNGGSAEGTRFNVTLNLKEEKSLSAIEIINPPDKTSYIEGENFDITGMVVEAIYDSGKTEEISNYEITDGNNLSVGKKNITIRYTENGVTRTTTQDITVIKQELDVKVKTYDVVKDNGTNYIEKIMPNTSIEMLKKNIETNGTVEIYKNDQKVLDNSNLIETGMEIVIKLNNKEERYIVIVTGDLTGNGKMGIGDLSKLARYAAGLDNTLSGAYLRASDVVKDGKYGRISDISKMSRVLAGMDNL